MQGYAIKTGIISYEELLEMGAEDLAEIAWEIFDDYDANQLLNWGRLELEEGAITLSGIQEHSYLIVK